MSKDHSHSASAIGLFTIANWHSGEYWSKYPPNLPPEYYTAIGEICHRWAWLEFQCGVIAREVIRLDKSSGRAFTAGMTLNTISKVLQTLALGDYLNNHPDLKERLRAISKTLGGLGDFRNEYAHGVWGNVAKHDPRLGLWKFKNPEDRLEPNWVHKTTTEMRQVADTLKGYQETLQQLTRDLKGALRGR
jgi:hypothetical protein